MGFFNTRGRRIGSFARDIVRRPSNPDPKARSGSVQQTGGRSGRNKHKSLFVPLLLSYAADAVC
jgi:hypothetical protein